MEYNTSRNMLLLPEYGRNVQNMIAHAIEIEDSVERNNAAKAIIEVMGQLNPHLRDVDDYRHKLWAHLFIMSDFKLDVESPYEIPTEEDLQGKPDQMPYPKGKIKFGHFGQYTQKILDTVSEMKDENEIKYMTHAMGNFMKKQYLIHNNTSVDNNLIAKQLKEMSSDILDMQDPDENLVSTNQLLKTLGLQNLPSNTNRNKKIQKKGHHHSKKKYKR